MDELLFQFQIERIDQLKLDMEEHGHDETQDWKTRLTTLVQMTGPYCPVRKAVVQFQYSTLKQTLLPRYEKFLLWLTLHQEGYFMMGKEQHARRDGKQVSPQEEPRIKYPQQYCLIHHMSFIYLLRVSRLFESHRGRLARNKWEMS